MTLTTASDDIDDRATDVIDDSASDVIDDSASDDIDDRATDVIDDSASDDIDDSASDDIDRSVTEDTSTVSSPSLPACGSCEVLHRQRFVSYLMALRHHDHCWRRAVLLARYLRRLQLRTSRFLWTPIFAFSGDF